MKMGICGEHGGDPGFDRLLPQDRSVLCVVLALPRAVARLAAAQAAIGGEG